LSENVAEKNEIATMKGHVIFKVPSLATNKSNCPD
jgi:hypothetical protein